MGARAAAVMNVCEGAKAARGGERICIGPPRAVKEFYYQWTLDNISDASDAVAHDFKMFIVGARRKRQ